MDSVVENLINGLDKAVAKHNIEGGKSLLRLLDSLIEKGVVRTNSLNNETRENLMSSIDRYKTMAGDLDLGTTSFTPPPSSCETCKGLKDGLSTESNDKLNAFLRSSGRKGSSLTFGGKDNEYAAYRMNKILDGTYRKTMWINHRSTDKTDEDIIYVRNELNKGCPILPKVVVIFDADDTTMKAWKNASFPNNTSIVFAFPKMAPLDVEFDVPTLQEKIDRYLTKIKCHPEVHRMTKEVMNQEMKNRNFAEVDRKASRDIYDANQ